MNILMCDTQYVFLQYFLLMPFDVFKDTFFVFDSCFSPSIVENLEKAGMACHQKLYNDIPLEERQMARNKNREYLKEIIKGFYDYFNGDICVYGQDHLDIVQILWHSELRQIPFILSEDGTGNYCKKSTLSRFPQFMGNNESFMGHNCRVQKIYLTGIWRIPNDVKSKVHIIDLRNLWEQKSEAEKQFFLSLYFMHQSTLNEISKKSVCYLGGPFSNFGMMPLEKELSAYRKIISNYNSADLYIKAHPTGFNINYEKEFPGISVVMNPIPYEVLYFLTGKNLKVIASICSTASMIADENVEQHYYDIEGNRIELRYPWDDLV
ncbi:glycosyltransferase family 52 [Anaerovibrio sp.]|uniref:glycosyltransferase family 52 n=1 Tax=Anaerovibrio sp. TaxID=1872532 RepID=UPI00388E4962